MSHLLNRVERLEGRSRPRDRAVVTAYYDARDNAALVDAWRKAKTQGAQLIVIKRFSDPATGEFNDTEPPDPRELAAAI
jgi:hypothetical protein